MQALLWRGPRAIGIERVEVPRPGPGEVLLQVAAVGICGSELSGYLGQNSLRRPPLIMGHEFGGLVVGRGPDVALPAEGARVVVNPLTHCGTCPYCHGARENLCPQRTLIGAHRPGAFAEYVAVPATCCHLLPEGLGWVEAALVEPLACGVRAVRRAGLAPGERLWIVGAGPMGLMALVAAGQAGIADVVVSDPNPRRLEVLRGFGAASLDPRAVDVVAALRAADGLGVHAAIDCVGLVATRRAAVAALRPGGRAVMLGLHVDETPFAVNDCVRAETEVVGSFSYAVADFQRALALLAAGALRPDPRWLSLWPFADGAGAFEYLLQAGERDAVTKVVLTLA
jgi:threonine dehydrogenase-like Zn-dependent dehydrogenase